MSAFPPHDEGAFFSDDKKSHRRRL
ncbi:putative type-1 fimbrial protein [Escherichia coli P12b]|nr:putative type-1 fimbrial protein [Escherichia coli P12b]